MPAASTTSTAATSVASAASTPLVSHTPSRMLHNRIGAVMLHIPWYTFQGQVRLARDAGVSKSAVSRLLAGRSTPSYPLVLALTQALERRLGRPLNPSELVSKDGTYPTKRVCQLCGCRGCLPAQAWDEDDRLRPAYRNMAAGTWSLSVASIASPSEPEKAASAASAACAARSVVGADG